MGGKTYPCSLPAGMQAPGRGSGNAEVGITLSVSAHLCQKMKNYLFSFLPTGWANYSLKNLDGQMYLVIPVAKQFFAYNPYPAGNLSGLAKPADDRFLVEVEAMALAINP